MYVGAQKVSLRWIIFAELNAKFVRKLLLHVARLALSCRRRVPSEPTIVDVDRLIHLAADLAVPMGRHQMRSAAVPPGRHRGAPATLSVQQQSVHKMHTKAISLLRLPLDNR